MLDITEEQREILKSHGLEKPHHFFYQFESIIDLITSFKDMTFPRIGFLIGFCDFSCKLTKTKKDQIIDQTGYINPVYEMPNPPTTSMNLERFVIGHVCKNYRVLEYSALKNQFNVIEIHPDQNEEYSRICLPKTPEEIYKWINPIITV